MLQRGVMESEDVRTTLERYTAKYDLSKVPFLDVPHAYCREMALLLQPPSENDWRMLAHHLRMPNKNMQAIPSIFRPDRDGLCALSVFAWYYDVMDNNVLEVLDILREMGRLDVLLILVTALPAIMENLSKPLRETATQARMPPHIPQYPSTERQVTVGYSLPASADSQFLEPDVPHILSYESTSTGYSGMPSGEFENDLYHLSEDRAPPMAEVLTRASYNLPSVRDEYSPRGPHVVAPPPTERPKHHRDQPLDDPPSKFLCPDPGIARLSNYDAPHSPLLQARGVGPPPARVSEVLSSADKLRNVDTWVQSTITSDGENSPGILRGPPTTSRAPPTDTDDLADKMQELRHTLPKREKRGEEGKAGLTTKRTISAGAELQKSEHIEAPRQHRVYITYSRDYTQGAIALQSYLRTHGFRVGLDDHDNPTNVPAEEHQKQIKKRFKAAKFVVVCVTPNYRATWDQSLPSLMTSQSGPIFNASPMRKPNTLSPCRVIYEFMKREYTKDREACVRYVVILCNNAKRSDVPPFLKCSISYEFPKEYKSFLTHIAKPKAIVDKFIAREKSMHSKSTCA